MKGKVTAMQRRTKTSKAHNNQVETQFKVLPQKKKKKKNEAIGGLKSQNLFTAANAALTIDCSSFYYGLHVVLHLERVPGRVEGAENGIGHHPLLYRRRSTQLLLFTPIRNKC
jgi:hypothetical protein